MIVLSYSVLNNGFKELKRLLRKIDQMLAVSKFESPRGLVGKTFKEPKQKTGKYREGWK